MSPLAQRPELEAAESASLAPYACRAADSRGREHPVAPDRWRTDFQRDRDRIIHSSYFRRLEFKTQVFSTHASDYPRTRLTHTMEVAQIARTLARCLNLNTDLAEAIALAHDLGHTPFGHAGEDAMKVCMKDHGGFEHNRQGLRVVTDLEERDPSRPGLNLTFEVREGIIKHDTAYDTPDPHPDYDPGRMPPLESQLVDLADEIAYNNADIDDAFKMGLIGIDDLAEVPWIAEVFDRAKHDAGPGTRAKFVRYRALGVLYELYAQDALSASADAIRDSGARTLDDVRGHAGKLVRFSPAFHAQLADLKAFLLARVYKHPKTMLYTYKAHKLVSEMFAHYLDHPLQLPVKHQRRIDSLGPHRVVCDYIAGMTDRFLMQQYRASFVPETLA